MLQFLFAINIFLLCIYYMIFIDIIGSWIGFRFKFITSVLGPVYKWIQSFIPTRIGILDFTPIIVLIVIALLQNFIPELAELYISKMGK